MPQVRGFVAFENRTLEEVQLEFRAPLEEGIQHRVFSELHRRGEFNPSPGIFLDGQTSQTSTMEIIKSLRWKMGLEGNAINCDVSLGEEDFIHPLVKGDIIEGSVYTGFRVEQPFEDDALKAIAEAIGKDMKAIDVLIRGIDPDKKTGKANARIDLICSGGLIGFGHNIEGLMKENNIKLGQMTQIHFV